MKEVATFEWTMTVPGDADQAELARCRDAMFQFENMVEFEFADPDGPCVVNASIAPSNKKHEEFGDFCIDLFSREFVTFRFSNIGVIKNMSMTGEGSLLVECNDGPSLHISCL